MLGRTSTGRRVYFVMSLVVLAGASALSAWAQHGSEGTVTVTVIDPSGERRTRRTT